MSRSLPRVVLAVLGLTAALLLTLAAGDWVERPPLALFYVAVAGAAAVAGVVVAGVIAVAAVLLVEWLIFPPRGTIVLTGDAILRDTLFLLAAMAVALLVSRLQQARREAVARQQESERLAATLREQAAELELQVTETEALANELEDMNQQLAEQTDATSRAAIRSERLHQFTALMLEQASEAAVGAGIVEEGRRALEAATAVVLRGGETGADVLAAGGADTQALSDVARFNEPGSPVYDAMHAGRAIFISDPIMLKQQYPAASWLAAGVHRAWAMLPLELERRRLGCLALAFDRPGEFSSEDRAFMLLVAQQCAQALDRARIYDLERRARVRAEFAERRLAFLADASERLASELNFLSTLANLAEHSVPEFADWCLIHLASDDGRPVLVAAAHDDPHQLQQRRELEQLYPPRVSAERGIGRVLRTGQLEHVAPVTEEMLQSIARDERHLRLMQSLGVREQLSVPIRSDDETTGVITFGLADSARTFDEADITLAEELGRRAGQAVQNARLYQAAHHASEAKSNFLAVMSHELRTPLNAIIGYSDLLLLGVPNAVPERALHQVERIRVAAAALLNLVEEVLSFSRIEAGKEEIRISPVELNGLLRECLTIVEPLAAEKNLQIRTLLPDTPVKIISDAGKIRQILTNLLSNAVKFTEEGGITLALHDGEQDVRIVVEDTGIGIPQEHLERIFDPFWQVEPASTRRFGGTGLGLGVARKLARLLDGQLEVNSVVGKGSRFALVLPVHAHHAARSA